MSLINRYGLVNLLEDRDVRRYIVYFLSKPTTITEVSRRLEFKNRRKITNMLKDYRLSAYIKKSDEYAPTNSKLTFLDYKLIIDYFTELFTLNKNESDSLFEFVSDERIKKALLSNNSDFDQLLNKLILWLFKVDVISKTSKKNIVYVSTYDALLDEGYHLPHKWDIELALTDIVRSGKIEFTFIKKLNDLNRKIHIPIGHIYQFIDGDLKGKDKELESRIKCRDALLKDDKLIYDPSTNLLLKRADFKKDYKN